MEAWWNNKVWPWLKKYGPLIIFPLGLLLVLARVFGGRRTSVVTSELLGAATVSNEAWKVKRQKTAVSAQDLKESLARLEGEHEDKVDEQVQDISDQVDALLEDPDELNQHLLDVGSQMREKT